jgi:hypothetical protein
MPKRPQSKTRRRSAQEWREIVDRWGRSGQSARVFAIQQHLSKPSLIWWRWRLRAEKTPTKPKLAFVPLVASSPRPPSSPSGEARWVLETKAGIRLEMSGATALVVDGLAVALQRLGGKA